jgi:hypothetical protein
MKRWLFFFYGVGRHLLFGAQYEQYQRRVPLLIPKWSAVHATATQQAHDDPSAAYRADAEAIHVSCTYLRSGGASSWPDSLKSPKS